MTDGRFFHVVAVTDNQNPLTGFTTQLLYYPQIIHITTFRITAAVIHLKVIFFSIGCLIVAFVRRTK